MFEDTLDELLEDEEDDGGEDPTAVAYGELRIAFQHFNNDLFGSDLPDCLITLQRRRSTYGYFAPTRFKYAQDRGPGSIDEIALNPQKWRHRQLDDNLSTLVHEMCHLWQHHFGKPSRSGYHNREWAEKMKSIGLIPSVDGKPGGRQTGQHMTHYIEKGGLFEKSCAEFVAMGYGLSFHDLTGEAEGKGSQTRAKFTCPGCSANAWGKPELHIDCRDCGQPMTVSGS